LYAIAFKHGLDYRDLAAWNGIASPYTIFAGRELRLSAPAHASTPSAPAASTMQAGAPTPEPTPGSAVTAGIAEHAAAKPSTSAFEDVPAPAPSPVTEAAKPAEPAPDVVDVAPASPAKPPLVVAAQAPKATVEPPRSMPPPKPAPEATHVDNTPELSSGGVTWRWPSEGKVIGVYVSGEPTKQGIDIGGKSGDPVRSAADGEVVYSGNGLIGYGELIIVKHNANFLSAYGHNRSRLVKEGDKVKAGQAIAEMGASASSRDELHFEIRKNGKPVNPLEYLPAR
jgi:lipoprotein NlpD